MIIRTMVWAKTLMREKCHMMWYGFAGKGINPPQMMTEAMKTEEFSWLDLPTEMVELIISKLPYSDRPKFSCVCKSWSSIMHTLPSIYPVGKSPILLHFETKDSGVAHYYSPHLNKTFQIELPMDFGGYEIISGIDGFVLIYDGIFDMLMINPLGGQIFELPGLTDSISFGGGVTIGVLDDYYVVFLIDWTNENEVVIHLYDAYPLTGWRVNLWFDNSKPFCMAPSSNPVYCDGCFYCLGKEWNLGIFDYLEGAWSIVDVEFKKKKKRDRDCMTADSYLVESGGTVIAAQMESNGVGIRIFCLDREKMVWEEIYDLGYQSLFVGSRMSMMSVPTTVKKLRNKVFVPHFRGEQKKIVVNLRQSRRLLLYFVSRFSISSKENDHDTGSICSYNMANWKKSEFFGSTEMSSCIWYQPY